MTQEHPLNPPLELRRQWRNQWHESEVKPALFPDWMNICIAQWGADQELEACRQWLEINGAPSEFIDGLLAYRRPQPPVSKEEALAALDLLCEGPDPTTFVKCRTTIRRALEEQLDD